MSACEHPVGRHGARATIVTDGCPTYDLALCRSCGRYIERTGGEAGSWSVVTHVAPHRFLQPAGAVAGADQSLTESHAR